MPRLATLLGSDAGQHSASFAGHNIYSVTLNAWGKIETAKLMTKMRPFSCAVVGIAILAGVQMPALGYTFGGGHANSGAIPSPGGVVAAKVIGQSCSGSLSVSEIDELDAYLAKASKEWSELQEARDKNGTNYRPVSFENLVEFLAKGYGPEYRDPQNCDEGASELAQDMLQRVRKAMISGAPALPGSGE